MDLIATAFSKIIVTMLGAILGPLTVPPAPTAKPRNDVEITRPAPAPPASPRQRPSPGPQPRKPI